MGVQTADGKYKVQLGLASRELGGKTQMEYSPELGQWFYILKAILVDINSFIVH